MIVLVIGFAALGPDAARADAPTALVLNQAVASQTTGADASWRLDAVPGDRFVIDAQNTGGSAIELCLLDPEGCHYPDLA